MVSSGLFEIEYSVVSSIYLYVGTSVVRSLIIRRKLLETVRSMIDRAVFTSKYTFLTLVYVLDCYGRCEYIGYFNTN